jgi:glycosyltransferase involved in cell wall biosynthesis
VTVPVRVRVVYTRYPHWGAHSGANQFVRYLDPAEYRVHVHASSDSDDDLPLRHERLRELLRRRVRRGGMGWYKLSDLNAELRALPGCLVGGTRIVHFLDAEHSAQYLPAVLRRARVARGRTVATYHQPPELLDGLVSGHVVAELDHVTVVSPTQLDYFRQFLPADRVEVVPHGIDTDFFVPRAGARDDGVFRCISVGHWLRDWDAVGAVARAFRGRRDVEFHVVTTHPTGLEGVENVIIHRGVSDDALARLYQQADVLFLPLTGATANNALLEGIASGLPVLSTDLPAVRAYLPGREAILTERGDVRTLSDALLYLRCDPDARVAMGASARARAEALSWRAVAPRIAGIYSRLASVR